MWNWVVGLLMLFAAVQGCIANISTNAIAHDAAKQDISPGAVLHRMMMVPVPVSSAAANVSANATTTDVGKMRYLPIKPEPWMRPRIPKAVAASHGQRHGTIPKSHLHRRKRHSRVSWARSHDYRDALSKSILFFEGQRSGRLPANQRISWRRNSALKDGHSAGVDLVGGYYDAGDNMKFGFPMAFTTTMLSWSLIEFGGLMGSELANARTAIRWATDYLLKATAHPNTVYVQVGDPSNDHKCWERPEDMNTLRTVFKVDTKNPGSDVAAETAAALAAASVVFRASDPGYSKMLLARAAKVYDFANKYKGSYSNSLRSEVCPYYCSYSGYQDEMLWGAAWLYKATGNPSYLNQIQSYAQDGDNVNVFGWDNKHVGAHLLLSKQFLVKKVKFLAKFKGHSDSYICSLIPGTGFSRSQYTPGGLLYFLPESNLQYVTASSFLVLTYAKYLGASKQTIRCGSVTLTPHRLRVLAKRQVDYILGDNPQGMSYMVGFGPKFPRRIHHRASSLPSKAMHPQAVGCEAGFSALYSTSPNPNLLVGAVVGGPDATDHFSDLRTDYTHSEPATYINAPLVGSLAYLAHSTAA